MRTHLRQVERWVVKIGSSMLTACEGGVDLDALRDWAGQIAALHEAGKQCILVTSGAIAVGMQILGWKKRSTQLCALQSAAAVGQMEIARAWQAAFAAHGVRVAQVLLTHEDASDRRRYLNIRSVLQRICGDRIVPVVNENDTVSFEEIRFGDNDTLGAMVANILTAGGYIILSDQEGMCTKNPRECNDAELIREVRANDPRLLAMAGKSGGALGSGGMYTKVLAARKAARSGTHTLLAHGRESSVITRLARGEPLGTLFCAMEDPQQARKQWLGSQLQAQGTLYLDDGAAAALTMHHKSLLPVGVRHVEGHFKRGELISCKTLEGRELARGLSNYNSKDCAILSGKRSEEVASLLVHGETLIHRDNLVLF